MLKSAQTEVDNAHREMLSAQQRLSAARSTENHAQRDLDVAQKQAR
jgi:outer membrane protein TolC